MIKAVNDFFIWPCHEANAARDASLENGTCLPSLKARLLYLVQLIASAAAIPFLFLAVLCDYTSHCFFAERPPEDMLLPFMTHLLILPAISVTGALLPLNCNK